MEIERGNVVQNVDQRIGVVSTTHEGIDWTYVIWFDEPQYGEMRAELAELTKLAGYEMEAALALGDTAKALELYRAEQKRMDGWQQHFQPLIDQYGAAEIAWIAGSIAAMVATGQFTPEDAIRHWAKPQAYIGNPENSIFWTELRQYEKAATEKPIIYGKSFAPAWVNDLERRFADKFRKAIQWPPPSWFVEGNRLVTARQQLDALTGGLSDAEWQEILDYCADVADKNADPDVFWKELAMWEIHARHVGGSKALMLETLRRAKGNG